QSVFTSDLTSSMIDELLFFSSRRRHTRSKRDWSSDVCSSDLVEAHVVGRAVVVGVVAEPHVVTTPYVLGEGTGHILARNEQVCERRCVPATSPSSPTAAPSAPSISSRCALGAQRARTPLAPGINAATLSPNKRMRRGAEEEVPLLTDVQEGAHPGSRLDAISKPGPSGPGR